jgi:hypothetical protein
MSYIVAIPRDSWIVSKLLKLAEVLPNSFHVPSGDYAVLGMLYAPDAPRPRKPLGTGCYLKVGEGRFALIGPNDEHPFPFPSLEEAQATAERIGGKVMETP